MAPGKTSGAPRLFTLTRYSLVRRVVVRKVITIGWQLEFLLFFVALNGLTQAASRGVHAAVAADTLYLNAIF